MFSQYRKIFYGLTILLLLAAWLGFLPFGKKQVASSRAPVGVVRNPNATLAAASTPRQSPTQANTTDTNIASVSRAVARTGKTNQPAQVLLDDNGQISASALKQIAALERAKAGRTPAQDKLDSQLIYAAKMQRSESIAEGISTQRIDLDRDPAGRILVDIRAVVTNELLEQIQNLGGKVVNSFKAFHAIRASLPVDVMETLAACADVKFIAPAARAVCHTGSVDSQGDYAHAAAAARLTFGVDGTGVKVGVISDSVDYLTNSQALGDLPASLTVLPGQSGVPGSGEGTAMLEIVHDLAPGAQLYFATAFNGEASFAQNILDLRAVGCDIIVDDVGYFDESPFQDAVIAQAVNSVTASGGRR